VIEHRGEEKYICTVTLITSHYYYTFKMLACVCIFLLCSFINGNTQKQSKNLFKITKKIFRLKIEKHFVRMHLEYNIIWKKKRKDAQLLLCNCKGLHLVIVCSKKYYNI